MLKLPGSELWAGLMVLPDPEFIQSCYKAVLFREIDPEGLSHSLVRLIAGEHRLAVAADISSSDEVRALPASRKGPAAEILALHAESLIRGAWTPKRREAAARRVHRYFYALTEAALAETASSGNAGGPGTGDDGDPFSTYFANVIHDRNY